MSRLLGRRRRNGHLSFLSTLSTQCKAKVEERNPLLIGDILVMEYRCSQGDLRCSILLVLRESSEWERCERLDTFQRIRPQDHHLSPNDLDLKGFDFWDLTSHYSDAPFHSSLCLNRFYSLQGTQRESSIWFERQPWALRNVAILIAGNSGTR